LLGDLAGPIASGLKQLVSGTVERVAASGAFETVWVNGNRRAHTAVDKALTGQADGAVSLKDNQVAIGVASQKTERAIPERPGDLHAASADSRPAWTASTSVWWSRSFWSA
jgi:hypothetical protein